MTRAIPKPMTLQQGLKLASIDDRIIKLIKK